MVIKMTRDYTLYEKVEIPSYDLPIIFHKFNLYRDSKMECKFYRHWHEKIEFLYFTKGEAIIGCGAQRIFAKVGDLIVINSNELHEGHALTEVVEYYCIIIDTSLFESRNIDICETKYIKPIYQNNILFENKIENDESVRICVENIIKEYESKDIGREVAIKAYIYQLIVILLRGHVKHMLTSREYDNRKKRLERFNKILKFIDEHFHEEITIDKLCSMANLSKYRFCHLFKEITGKSFSEYLNMVRINKAEELLHETDMNVTEIALSCGYNDANYFSRVFKKYRKQAPSKLVKNRKFSDGSDTPETSVAGY